MMLFRKTPRDDLNVSDAERIAWLRLCRTENVGPITFYQLIDTFGSAENALNALPELAKRGGRKKPLIAASLSDAEREYATLKKHGGHILTPLDADYPLALSAIDDAPPVISTLGDIKFLNKPCIAIVGARNASLNGRKFAHKLAADLGGRGQIVVSGLARGIDTAAHQGAIHTGTIAVVAGGIDIVYPEENQKLYEDIITHGLVVAESKWGQQPYAQSFPRRNRIVSGLSRGVIVVEATLRSGSLITARMAGEQGREVYAVPGSPMDPRAEGPNHLLREGATLIRGADDVLEGLLDFAGRPKMTRTKTSEPAPKGFGEPVQTFAPEHLRDAILDQLSHVPILTDELIRALGCSAAEIQGTLLELELAGRIKRLPGARICLLDE